MSSRRFNDRWIVVDQMYENPTWDECYAVLDTDWQFADDTDGLVSTMESELDDFTPEEKHHVDPKEEEWWVSAPSSPATSWSPPHNAPWTRSHRRRSRGAAASHRHKAQQYRGFRAPFSMQRRRGCGCNCSRWRYTPRRYRQRVTSWEHLPVAIQPTEWYQVVGSRQCSHCKAQGRHQMTSWMCRICEVPLCLTPLRNCYSKWHGQGC
ncbi:uncharacterized protein LOC119495403 [Sebastes umbrosus]|uniref:uncharacterized protein LOC119495403 n=1 Tax=Sebastes umbrosus TaxID=72105 RepID=UPI00189CB85F|nr:uncharacterized protein LOC119495403 [Sebastes umbrosus]